jgi:hypothetical protein
MHLLILNHAVLQERELTWYSLGIPVLQMDIFSELVTGSSPRFSFTLSTSPQFLHLMIGLCHSNQEQHELATPIPNKDPANAATMPTYRHQQFWFPA